MTDDLRAAREFQAYLRAREAVLEMKAGSATVAGSEAVDPSAYWADELENIDYMIDASPLIVRKLRQHAFHITGIRPYDYRTKPDRRREFFEARYRALRELGGAALVVPEPAALGGFGYEIDGARFNVDTIKYLEVLVGMETGKVLPYLRQLGRRAMVCEIGAGWGGFAFQFKTLFPNTTYVIVDFAELFLFSATYLMTMFPDARVHFCTSADAAPVDTWGSADFVFVPHTLPSLVASAPLDLTVNMVSFQEMTEAQVRAYADMAAQASCPWLYSLNRERSPYNDELGSVSDALATRYRLSEVPVLDTDYTSAMKKPSRPRREGERLELGYRHLVGQLRTAAPGHSGERANGDPTTVLGMTLYNNAAHLREALDSLLGQTNPDFRLLLLDDASTDATETIAREYEARDRRVRYVRHASRRAMIATWREVAELAFREFPSASYFAWVSDHDRWAPNWLALLAAELDRHPDAVLAYPITQRMTMVGDDIDKGPRRFAAVGLRDPRARWRQFCYHGVGSGDMVYGLMRVEALRRAGIFRTVLRPDRLLVAEMSLHGEIRQVDRVLWFRRQSHGSSIERQRHTLVRPEEAPRWFWWPPWIQHSVMLYREYAQAEPRPLPIGRLAWLWLIALYQFTYAWRHFRKSETSHWFGRVVKRTIWCWKMTKHHYHHAVYNTLVRGRELRAHARRSIRRWIYNVLVARQQAMTHVRWGLLVGWARVRRMWRRGIYRLLLWTHRAGLRGPGQTPSP
jgi:glycosyltransferase involved in cell wall biosynthesis